MNGYIIRISCPSYPKESIRVRYYNGRMGDIRETAKVYETYGKAISAIKHDKYGMGDVWNRSNGDTGDIVYYPTEIEIINADES